MIVPDGNNGMVMPVSPMNGGYNGGFDGGWGSWIILFLIFGMFGNGGFGGFNGGMMNFDFPWLMSNTNNGFNQQAIQTGLSDVRLGIADVSQQICNTGNNIVQQMYSNQIAELERSFAAQTANTAAMNALQAQFAQCCCDNRLATVQTQNVVQSEGAATRQAIQQGIQSLSDKLCQLELDGVKAERDNYKNQLQMATLAASQRAQTAEIENYIRPQINPSYNVPNPYASCPNAANGFAA